MTFMILKIFDLLKFYLYFRRVLERMLSYAVSLFPRVIMIPYNLIPTIFLEIVNAPVEEFILSDHVNDVCAALSSEFKLGELG